MFRILRWFFITLVLVALALGLAFGFKQAQNKYYPAYRSNGLANSNFTGNKDSLKEAIQSGVLLLKQENYRVFLLSYIPEEGREQFIKGGQLDEKFIQNFKRGKASEMLEVLTGCITQEYQMSDNGNRGVCTLEAKKKGKNKMTFLREQGVWRIEN